MQDNIITRQYSCPECGSRNLSIAGLDIQICMSCGKESRCQIPETTRRNKVNVEKRDLNSVIGFQQKKAKQKTHKQIMAEIKLEELTCCPKCNNHTLEKVPKYSGSDKKIYKCRDEKCNYFCSISEIEPKKEATFESIERIGEPIKCPRCDMLTFCKSKVMGGKSIYMQCVNKICNHYDKYIEKNGKMVEYSSMAEVLEEENVNGTQFEVPDFEPNTEQGDDEDGL